MIWFAVIGKVVVASSLALVAEIVGRRCRAEVSFSLWLGVLLVLCLPPCVSVPILDRGVTASFEARASHLAVAEPSVARTSLSTTAEPSGSSLGRALGQGSWAGVCDLIQTGLLVIWALGTAFVLFREFRVRRDLGRLVSAAAPASKRLRDANRRAAECLGLKRFPQITVANGVFSPFLWHVRSSRARIVFPEGLVDGLSTSAIHSILTHELIHFRRGDGWRHLLESLVVAVWWWCPVSWCTRRRLGELEEICTDREVLRSAPGVRVAYARALLDSVDFLSQPTCRIENSPAFAGGGTLRPRIEGILGSAPATLRRGRLGSFLVMAIIPLAVLTPGGVAEMPVSAKNGDGCAQRSDAGPLDLDLRVQRVGQCAADGCDPCDRALLEFKRAFLDVESADLTHALETLRNDVHLGDASRNTLAWAVEAFQRAACESECVSKTMPVPHRLSYRVALIRACANARCPSCGSVVSLLEGVDHVASVENLIRRTAELERSTGSSASPSTNEDLARTRAELEAALQTVANR